MESRSGNFLEQLATRMRSDWDRRVRHDYRFWMSDAYKSDQQMWESGARDFAILTNGLETSGKTSLEVGCGIGRLMRPAAGAFKKAIGCDVSQAAISKASELLKDLPNVELHLTSGLELSFAAPNSIDVALSFATLSSVSVEVFSNYLLEFNRVLIDGGDLRLQLYLGFAQEVASDDTLHLRCYEQNNLFAGLKAAGFDLTMLEELVLPFQVSAKELGILAVVVGAKRAQNASATREEISRILLPQGEAPKSGIDLESYMSLRYAEELLAQGFNDQAWEAVQFAAAVGKATSIEVSDLLQRITDQISKQGAQKPPAPTNNEFAKNELQKSSTFAEPLSLAPLQSSPFESNIRIISERFPELYQALMSAKAIGEISQTEDGPVLSYQGQCLDHASKPRSGARHWVQRSLTDSRLPKAPEAVVIGFGLGYHIEELLAAWAAPEGKSLHVIEPHLGLLRRALEVRDLTGILSKIASLAAEIKEVSPEAELLTRPQQQLLFPSEVAQNRAKFYESRGLSLRPRIGVMGPLHGGTLPIMAYCIRSLGDLRQKVREYDVSGFDPGYNLLPRFVIDKFRRKPVEAAYTEMVSEIVMQSVAEKPIDILLCMALAPITPRVLEELRKAGIVTVLWFVEDFLRFTYWQQYAKHFDFIFTIQKGACQDAIRKAGCSEVHYLPVGCDPGIHAPVELTAEERLRYGSQISFMGAGYHNRQQLFASLADYPLKIWGTEWPTCRPFDRLVQEGGRRLLPVEYVKIFAASEININLHSSTERDGVDPFGDFLNPRTFELAASGAFQLVDERSLLGNEFEVGKEIVTFSSTADLKEKIKYYLAHPEERAAIAERGRARALRDHTYHARLRSMLRTIYGSRYDHLKRREDASPWSRMLERCKPHPELLKRAEESCNRGEEPNLDGLISDIVSGNGKLSETEQKLLFLYHVRKQMIRMRMEELGLKQ